MWTIKVTGRNGGKVNKALNSAVTVATRNFLEQLGIHKHRGYINIRCHNDSGLKHEKTTYGEVEPLDSKPRKFRLDVAMYSDWLLTLAHECVHIKQFVKKETDLYMTMWKGRNINVEEYMRLPYEKEAFKLQRQLVRVFTKESE